MKYGHILKYVTETPWAITPAKLGEIQALIELRLAGMKFTHEEIEARIGAAVPSRPPRSAGAVAVLPLYGVVSQRMGLMTMMSGGTSTQRFAQILRAALADETVKGIVIDCDSPGGSVYGLDELAAEVFAAREKKPIVASCNSLCASAAYYIASAAERIDVTPSGQIGSIGCLALHINEAGAYELEGLSPELFSYGDNKGLGRPEVPLTDPARVEMQAQVDFYGRQFEAAVARNRGVSTATVRSAFGQGKLFQAQDAVRIGMADRVATFEQTLASMGAGGDGARTAIPLASAECRVPSAEEGGDHVAGGGEMVDLEIERGRSRQRMRAR